MFLARKINKVPARTYGKLLRDEKGSLVLQYRPWLVLPERTLVLPEGPLRRRQGPVLFADHESGRPGAHRGDALAAALSRA